VSLDAAKLQQAKAWLADHVNEGKYRVVVVRRGRVAAEWYHGLGADAEQRMASAAKSVFSSMLGIAVAEGKIASADAKVIGYYPEFMDVPDGTGPKPGRYAFEKDREITLRQLISNTSGYMKPDEAPGNVFHYQTYGMNILTHAIAKTYGLYDSNDPENSPGLKVLVEDRLGKPIGAKLAYYWANFKLQPEARLNIFGYYDGIQATALDLARLGWLWCNWGRWEDRQLIPKAWLLEATQTSLDIRLHGSLEERCYGHGFWTNDYLRLLPNLPRDIFMALGAGNQAIMVCPSLELVVVASPGLKAHEAEGFSTLFELIAAACV
jgi:CubicO group peptidase (beta-lactamase class C family)